MRFSNCSAQVTFNSATKIHVNTNNMLILIYIYNSVLTCQQTIINATASAPPNATKIAVKKVSKVKVSMFGPEL